MEILSISMDLKNRVSEVPPYCLLCEHFAEIWNRSQELNGIYYLLPGISFTFVIRGGGFQLSMLSKRVHREL